MHSTSSDRLPLKGSPASCLARDSSLQRRAGPRPSRSGRWWPRCPRWSGRGSARQRAQPGNNGSRVTYL